MRWFFVAAALAGCAAAERSTFGNGTGGDSGIRLLDGSRTIDSPRFLDAPGNGMTSVTLTQTTDNTIAAGSSLACGGCKAFDAMLNCIDYRTNENAYYRVFKMSDYSITGTLHIKQVTFGVQEAGGTNSVQV